MDNAKVYIKENKERFISELLDLLRIPSISAQSERKPDMQRRANMRAQLRQGLVGGENCQRNQFPGFPAEGSLFKNLSEQKTV